MNYRNLTEAEIIRLKEQHCTCSNWSKVKVSEEFNPKYVKHVHFSGNVTIGKFEKVFELEGGLKQHSGIYHATIHNCQIGDNVFIANIHRYIANYIISENCYIENTNLLVTEENSTFGNGVEITVLNEGGGRELTIADNLSSHLAYIQTIYRHRKGTVNKIKSIIATYTDSIRSNIGYIAPNVKITTCRNIKNVKIGENATIDSASELTNGSINSNASDPVYIGNGVIAKNFIISSGVQATDDILIENCFIGQGTLLGKHFSIYDSVYFCNCQGFHGEVCSVFGGPYTVTHHKSSLLIAGLYSFLNAGSGSNQSNHMYKLGPIHQGVVERGSKTTSDSYILWPAKIGPFSLVMGRHSQHSDTSNLPFSYLIENNGETYIVPGINIKSVGTIRDAQKWPKRDRRKDPNKLEQINFNLLSPYTIQKMYAGINILNTVKSLSGENSQIYSYNNTVIKKSSLKKGITFYNMAINKFLGNSIIKRLEETKFTSVDEVRNQLKPSTEIGLGTWNDLSGLITPATEIEKLLNDIDNNTLTTLEDINKRFQDIHKNYYEYEWTWALEKIEEKLNKKYTEFTIEDIINIVHVWTKSVVELDELLYEDAKKEFDLISRTGFGADGDEKTKIQDFNNVRGKFEENPFVKEVLRHIEMKTALGQELITRIEHLA